MGGFDVQYRLQFPVSFLFRRRGVRRLAHRKSIGNFSFKKILRYFMRLRRLAAVASAIHRDGSD
jgi:hypothetical protein